MLYIVPTPIGNSEDITLRALRLLQEIDLIITENTSTTKKLLTIYNINYQDKTFVKFTSHDHRNINTLIDKLNQQDALLVSEAGTPCLSDPGKLLIIHAQEHHIPITILPGANALIPAVIGAGFPTIHWSFYGFLPHKKGREKILTQIISDSKPSFFYESVHRISKLLEQLKKLGYHGTMTIQRELSKKFEQVITDNIDQIEQFIASGELPLKGEFVIGIYPHYSKYDTTE